MKDYVLQINRNGLFYGKYKYKLSYILNFVNHIRYIKSIDDFEKDIVYDTSKSRSLFDRTILLTSLVSENDATDMKNIIVLRNSDQYICSRIEHNTICFYSNSKDTLDNIESMLLNKEKITKFELPDNISNGKVIRLNNPKFKYRAYLKREKWKASDRNKLIDFLSESVKFCKESRTVSNWLHGRQYFFNNIGSMMHKDLWSSEHFFIDFADEKHITYFGIKFPTALKKILTIEKR